MWSNVPCTWLDRRASITGTFMKIMILHTFWYYTSGLLLDARQMVYTKCDEMLLVGWSLFAMQHKGLEEYYTSVLNNRLLLIIIRAEIKSKEI